ncbi:MAG: hypothetical protein HY866_02380 [Chloroflexi bacterium]|nr:hypothetical protein [Chloroflexota bacterium]
MRTPAGKECPHYYQDFNRGRSVQECRLVKSNADSMKWRPGDCARCSVPDIVRANASPDMKLSLTIEGVWLGFVRRMRVEAWCLRHDIPIENPYVGCPQDIEENDGLRLFKEALEHKDDD